MCLPQVYHAGMENLEVREAPTQYGGLLQILLVLQESYRLAAALPGVLCLQEEYEVQGAEDLESCF